MMRRFSIVLGGLAALVAAAGLCAFAFFRVYVHADECLVLIRKTGAPRPPGAKVAEAGQQGILRETLGPGRYFLNPWTYDWERHPLVTVPVGDPQTWREAFNSADDTGVPRLEGQWPQVGILVNKVGPPDPQGREVVDEGYQGIQRRVLTPGTYRINPYVFEVRMVPATVVPVGYCGVVTSQLGEMPGVETVEEVSVGPDGQPVKGQAKVIQKLAVAGQRGVLRDVLPPGIYYLNPYVHKVQIVQVGYNQITQDALRARSERGGAEPSGGRAKGQQAQQAAQGQAGLHDLSTHITFPSKDGFTIDVEVTVVWGRHPAHIAEMLNRFGDIEKIMAIIISQMRSICRNIGSDYESTDFIRGEQRELYQRAVTETLQRACRERDIEILIALIHNIEVRGSPEAEKEGMDLKKTIQRGFIAKEQDLTKQAQRETARVKADLETAKVGVEIARERIAADTRKQVAEIKATGEKQAQETLAQRDLEVAQVERQIADLDAETTRLLGKARADVEQLRNQADADGKRLMIAAFGSGNAYNLYTFAENFAPESIRLIFAGEGTFWTDLSRAQDAAALELLRSAPAGKSNTPPAVGPAPREERPR